VDASLESEAQGLQLYSFANAELRPRDDRVCGAWEIEAAIIPVQEIIFCDSEVRLKPDVVRAHEHETRNGTSSWPCQAL